jgi:hypothetical protein
MIVIVPSRGRPKRVAELIDAFVSTRTGPTTLFIAVDSDDPCLQDYMNLVTTDFPDRVHIHVRGRLRLAGTLNHYVNVFIEEHLANPDARPRTDIFGFMGDDHRPRTTGWDAIIEREMAHMGGTGIVYGNDLLQGQTLPTAVFMSANIVETLGYMVPPGLVHMYLDNTWKTWGEAMNRLKYLPDVIFEHMHPVAGKAEWDAGYVEVNAGQRYIDDERAFREYTLSQRFIDDVNKMRSLL